MNFCGENIEIRYVPSMSFRAHEDAAVRLSAGDHFLCYDVFVNGNPNAVTSS